MKISEACSFLSDLYDIEVRILSGKKGFQQFCQQNYYYAVQKEFDPDFLMSLCKELPTASIHYIEDALLIDLILIKTKQDLIAVGPYITRDMTEANVQFLLHSSDIEEFPIKEYRAYRSRFPLYDNIGIARGVSVLLKHAGYDPSSFAIENHSYTPSPARRSWDYQHRNFENLINDRYRIERQMMDMIAAGNETEAVRYYRTIHNNVRYMGDFGSRPEMSRVSSGITRSTVRMAALEAGLSPSIIDRISGESSRVISNLNSREEMYQENERMIRNFAREVKKFREGKYSVLVYKAIDMLEHEYHKAVTIEECADRLGVSVSTLIRRFKSETGKTPGEYLFDLRIEKAKRLLRSDASSIQEVAESVGIYDANYFVKCFKKKMGMTPSVYRKNYFKKTP